MAAEVRRSCKQEGPGDLSTRSLTCVFPYLYLYHFVHVDADTFQWIFKHLIKEFNLATILTFDKVEVTDEDIVVLLTTLWERAAVFPFTVFSC